jgi:hypothetical protein
MARKRRTPVLPRHDADIHKGSTEDARLFASFGGQLAHRGQDDDLKDFDTDFPEPGSSPEHSGQHPVEVGGVTRKK